MKFCCKIPTTRIAHHCCFWIENNNYIKWYLGIVDNIKPEGRIVVSYMIKADKDGKSWKVPENDDINDDTSSDQCATKVHVHYSGSVRIKCNNKADKVNATKDALLSKNQLKDQFWLIWQQ